MKRWHACIMLASWPIAHPTSACRLDGNYSPRRWWNYLRRQL